MKLTVKNKYPIFLILALIFFQFSTNAQNTVLDQYIEKANSTQNLNVLEIPKYPQIENAETQLSPEDEQQTQIQFKMPIYNTI